VNDIKFSLEPEQLKTLETEELYNYLFNNLRQNHLQKMYETVTDKLQNFEVQLEEIEQEADRRDLEPDYKSCFEMLNEEEQQEILEQLEKYRNKMVI
jgi:hypothetical protein